MSRASGFLLALLAAIACSAGSATTTGAASTAPCQAFALPAAAAGQPPPAVLQDVAGAAAEYLLGVPGQQPKVMSPPSTGVPHLAGGTLWLSRPAPTPEVEAISGGACRRVAAGELLDVAPGGKALLVSTGPQTELLLDQAGHHIAKLAPQAVEWLGDGRPVASNGTAVAVYSGAQVTTVPHDSTTQVVAALGSDRLVALKGRTVELLSLSGQAAPLAQRALEPAAGSPDGRYVAGLDPYADQLLLIDVATGSTIVLPNPGAVLRLRWSDDSQWIAVVGRYGGSVVHAADRRVISLGSLNVLSW